MLIRSLRIGVCAIAPILLLMIASPAEAQRATPFPSWQPESLRAGAESPAVPRASVSTGGTTKGLLIGAAVGAAATTLFLIGFCGDPDTVCQGDEVARAALIIGVPIAAVGALIGALAD